MKKLVLPLAAGLILVFTEMSFAAGPSFLRCTFNKDVTLDASSRGDSDTPSGCIQHPKRQTPTCGYKMELPESLDTYATAKASLVTDAAVVWPDEPQTRKKLTLKLADYSSAHYKKGLEIPPATTYAATLALTPSGEPLRGTCVASFVQNKMN